MHRRRQARQLLVHLRVGAQVSRALVSWGGARGFSAAMSGSALSTCQTGAQVLGALCTAQRKTSG